MTEEIELIKAIDAFLTRHGEADKPMPESTFGRKALNNPNFIDDIRKGRSPTGRTSRKLKVWMKNEDTKLRRKRDVTESRETL